MHSRVHADNVLYVADHKAVEFITNQWCSLRLSVLGQDRSETKKIGLGLDLARCGLCPAHCGLGLGLAVLVFCETWSCNARRHNDLEGHNNFLSPFIVSLFCAWTSLLWRSTVAFTYLKVKSEKCLCLPPVVLVLSFWSCKQWSWS